MKHQVVIHDASAHQWLHFFEPFQVIEAHSIEDVIPALCSVENMVQKHGLYAAGFISYEASPAFDDALKVQPPSPFPLLWFGLYSRPEVIQLSHTSTGSTSSPVNWTPSVSRTEYDHVIADIKEYILRGETYQVNYTFRMRAPFAGDAWAFFLELARAQQADYAAYIDTARYVICSASPELFFRLDGNRMMSRPMKGTAARGRTLSEDNDRARWLRHSEKNRAENVMIVDMIRNDMGRVADTGSVEVSSLFDVERYPTIWQMTSTVTAMTDASLCDIMGALFPCASITGAPKPHTMQIIASLEKSPRSIYTGCIGFITPERNMQFNVAIRTVLIDKSKDTAEYGVGGGIVWDSISDEEYGECCDKALVLTARRPEFSLLETMLWTPDDGYFLFEYHLRRVEDSAEYFGFPVHEEQIRGKLMTMAESYPPVPHKIRLLVSRDRDITCQVTQLDETEMQQPVRLRLAENAIDSSDPFLYHKTTHRQVYDTARAAVSDCDDVLLWNEQGEITETTIANIIVERDGELLTPPVHCGLLPGTFRAWLLDRGDIKEEVITVEAFKGYEHIYLVNSVRKQREALMVW